MFTEHPKSDTLFAACPFKFKIMTFFMISIGFHWYGTMGFQHQIRDLELIMYLTPSSEGVRRSADMQTASIFVSLNDPHIFTGPQHFNLLASQKITFFSLILCPDFQDPGAPTFCGLS